MSNVRRGRRLSWIAALACFLLPASASGAVTVGSNLDAAPVDEAVSCGSVACTSSHQELPAGSTAADGLLAPIDGVVVAWRVKVGTVTGPIALRVTRPGDSDTRTGSGTSAAETPAEDGISTFDPVRLPINAGDALGIDYATTTAFATTADASSPVWDPALGDGEQPPRVASGAESELLLNADIEPDADGDGFGDETQDLCPTDASTQGLCPVEPPPPEPPGPEPPAPEPPSPGDPGELRLSVDRRVEMYKRARVVAEGVASSPAELWVYAVPHANACTRTPSKRGPRPRTIISPTAVQGDFKLRKQVKLKSRGRHSFCGYLGPAGNSEYMTAFKQRRVLRPHLKKSRARRSITRALRRHKFAGRVVKHLEGSCGRRNRAKFSCRFSSKFPGYKLTGRGKVRLDRKLKYRFRVRVGGLSIVLKPGNEGRFPG